MPHPDYKEEIEKQYPIKKGEISLESDLKEERIIGAEWFRDTIHLPALASKDKEIERLRGELDEAKEIFQILSTREPQAGMVNIFQRINNFINKPNP